MEPVWKTTRNFATHNRFYPTKADRDAALRYTFGRFQRQPSRSWYDASRRISG